MCTSKQKDLVDYWKGSYISELRKLLAVKSTVFTDTYTKLSEYEYHSSENDLYLVKINVTATDENKELQRYRYAVLPKALKEEWSANIKDNETYIISQDEFGQIFT